MSDETGDSEFNDEPLSPVVPLWIFQFVNPWMKPLLRSRLRGLVARHVMLVTITGRNSGQSIVTPVAYFRWAEDEVIVYSSSRWWRNCLTGKNVTVLVDGQTFSARPTVIRKREAVLETVKEFRTRVGHKAARRLRMGVPRKDRELTDEELAKIRRGFVFIHFSLRDPQNAATPGP